MSQLPSWFPPTLPLPVSPPPPSLRCPYYLSNWRERPYHRCWINRTWISIPWLPCQNCTHPIGPWGIPLPDIQYSISELWVVMVWGILQGTQQSHPSGIGPRSLETPATWPYWICTQRKDTEIPWIKPGNPQPWMTKWLWEFHVKEHVGKISPQQWYQNCGRRGSQKARHILDSKRVSYHVGAVSYQLDVILEIALSLVGFWYVPCVREGTLTNLLGLPAASTSSYDFSI